MSIGQQATVSVHGYVSPEAGDTPVCNNGPNNPILQATHVKDFLDADFSGIPQIACQLSDKERVGAYINDAIAVLESQRGADSSIALSDAINRLNALKDGVASQQVSPDVARVTIADVVTSRAMPEETRKALQSAIHARAEAEQDEEMQEALRLAEREQALVVQEQAVIAQRAETREALINMGVDPGLANAVAYNQHADSLESVTANYTQKQTDYEQAQASGDPQQIREAREAYQAAVVDRFGTSAAMFSDQQAATGLLLEVQLRVHVQRGGHDVSQLQAIPPGVKRINWAYEQGLIDENTHAAMLRTHAMTEEAQAGRDLAEQQGFARVDTIYEDRLEEMEAEVEAAQDLVPESEHGMSDRTLVRKAQEFAQRERREEAQRRREEAREEIVARAVDAELDVQRRLQGESQRDPEKASFVNQVINDRRRDADGRVMSEAEWRQAEIARRTADAQNAIIMGRAPRDEPEPQPTPAAEEVQRAEAATSKAPPGASPEVLAAARAVKPTTPVAHSTEEPAEGDEAATPKSGVETMAAAKDQGSPAVASV